MAGFDQAEQQTFSQQGFLLKIEQELYKSLLIP